MVKMSDDKNMQLVQGVISAIEHGRIEEMNSFLSNNSVLTIHDSVPDPFKGTFKGRDEINKHMLKCSMQLIPNSTSYTIRNLISKEGKVVVELGKKSYINDKNIFNNYCVLFEVKEGEITSLTVYVET